MYRKDPRFSQDGAVSILQKIIQDFDPLNPQGIPELEVVETIEEPTQNETLAINETSENEESKKVIVCQSFSDDNEDVDLSSCRRILKYTDKKEDGVGYCFLNHPKIEKDQVLQWTVHVPKFHFHSRIGMVITKEYKNFDFLDITFFKPLVYLSIHQRRIGSEKSRMTRV